MYTIYKLWNEINIKLYIGQTIDLTKRARGGEGYKGCCHLYRAIKKYGWEVFHYEILAECKTQEEANALEIYYIQLYDTTNPEKGYNISAGGTTRSDNEKTKRKISNSIKTLWQDPTYAKNTIEKRKLAWTDESREKQRQQIQKMRQETDFQQRATEGFQKWYSTLSPKEKEKYIEHRAQSRRKKVICLNTNEIFNSMREACDKYHLDSGSLTRACQGKQKHTGKHPVTQEKLAWAYYDNKEEKK